MNTLKGAYEKIWRMLFGVLQSERGQGLVEYGLIVVLIAIIVILMLKGSGEQVNSLYSKINSSFNP